jgi:hypothetical protein
LNGLKDLREMAHRLKPGERVIMVVVDHRSGRKGYIQVRAH